MLSVGHLASEQLSEAVIIPGIHSVEQSSWDENCVHLVPKALDDLVTVKRKPPQVHHWSEEVILSHLRLFEGCHFDTESLTR